MQNPFPIKSTRTMSATGASICHRFSAARSQTRANRWYAWRTLSPLTWFWLVLLLGLSNGSPLSAQTCVPVPASCIAWWSGDANFFDLAGTNSAVSANSVGFAPGTVGQAFSFNGSNQFLAVAGSHYFGGNRTIEAWIYPGANPGIGGPIVTAGAAGQADFWGIAGTGLGLLANELYIDHWQHAGYYRSFLSVPSNRWSHVAMVYDASSPNVTFYLNGVASSPSGGALYSSDLSTFTIAGNAVGGTTTKPSLNGLVDEVAVYDRALSSNEIQAIYNAGSAGKCKPWCLPLSPGCVARWTGDGNANDIQGANHGTPMGGAGFAAGKVGQSFSFDGVDDWVVIPHTPTIDFGRNDSFSVEFWLRPSVSTSRMVFLMKNASAYPYTGYYFDIHAPAPNCLRFILDGGAPQVEIIDHDDNRMSDGLWHHVAGVVDRASNMAFLYLDGTRVASGSVAEIESLQNGDPLLLGIQIGNFNRYRGELDELSIYHRALTSNEIAAIYAAGSVGICKPTDTVPVILNQPSDTPVVIGGNAFFRVVVTGAEPMAYAWRFNGTNIVTQTNAALLLTNVTLNQAGAYSVAVLNRFGSVVSSNAALFLVDPADDDRDGLPNQWEFLYGLNPTNALDASTRPPGDQLTYLLKFRYGLNPLTPDTDGDGLSDYRELFEYGTNPLMTDTDGDGMLDKWEVDYDLNPRVNDANSDLDLDGLTNLQEYQMWLTNHVQRPDRADSIGDGQNDYERLFGSQTNRFYYDRNDRLIGADYNRGSNGFAIAYVYDGNGNLLRQKNLVRDANRNGLPDVWEYLSGLTNNASAYADSDGDGWTYTQEWKAGTNPRDAASQPGVLGNPGLNIATLQLPFAPPNFVMGVGQLDGLGAEEIVIGADGNPGTTTNFLLVLTQDATNWSKQRVDVGPFGITSIAVGQVTNRPGPAIYVGLRGTTNGSGRVMEFTSKDGVWQSNVVAASTTQTAFVLGLRGLDLLVGLASTNGNNGSLFSVTSFSNSWNALLSITNASNRGLGGIQNLDSNTLTSMRLLDGGGIQLGTIQNAVMTQGLVAYYPFQGNANDASGHGHHGTVFGATSSADRFGNPSAAFTFGGGTGNYVIINPFSGFPTNLITVGFWMRSSDTNNYGAPLSYAVGGPGGDNEFGFEYRSFYLSIRGNAIGPNNLSATDGLWTHIALTWGSSDGQYKFYRNGLLAKTGFVSAGSPIRSDGALVFGQEQDSVGGTFDPAQAFVGQLDDVLIYNRVLNEQEIAVLAGVVPMTITEPAATRIYNWRGFSLASGFVRGTNDSSVFYSFTDDKNANGLVDFADEFITAEYLVSGTNGSLLTLSRQPIASSTVAQSYGLAAVNFLNASSEVFFTGEPDGQVFAWTATGATNPLQRQLFSAHHAGKAWHALAGVKTKTLEPGESLVGLRVGPTASNTCDVILWPPQLQLPQLASLPQTAPTASVLPQKGNAGTLVPVRIRLWDAEGNASTPFLQYQLPGVTNWQDAAIAFLDGAAYSPTNKVPALPTGSDHVLTWNASTVFPTPGPTNLWFRVRAQDMTLAGDWSAPMPYSLTVTADIDGDGLPDVWEMQEFGTLSYGPADDPDHDGMNNLEEYLADTHPNDPNSKLAVRLAVAGGQVVVNWQGGIQATQYLQRRFTLDGSNSWRDILTNPAPTPTTGSYTDLLGTNAMQFYRMKVVQ